MAKAKGKKLPKGKRKGKQRGTAVKVDGYKRKDGTKVDSYRRGKPGGKRG